MEFVKTIEQHEREQKEKREGLLGPATCSTKYAVEWTNSHGEVGRMAALFDTPQDAIKHRDWCFREWQKQPPTNIIEIIHTERVWSNSIWVEVSQSNSV